MTGCQRIAEGEREVKRETERGLSWYWAAERMRRDDQWWILVDSSGVTGSQQMIWCTGEEPVLLVVQESWVNGDGRRIIRNILCYSHFPKGNLFGYYVDMCCKKPFISSRSEASGRDDGIHGVQCPHQCFVSFMGIQEQSVKMSFTSLSHWAGLYAVRLKHGHWSWSWPLRTTLVISFRCPRSHSPIGPAENMHLCYLWQRPHQAALHKLD